MNDALPLPRTNVLAWLSLVLGLLVPLTCGATGPFALLFGFLALRRVNLSDGRLSGARAAAAGMVFGLFGVVLFLGSLVVVGLNQLHDTSDLAVCTNNLRRIGQAVALYHVADNADDRYPTGTIPNPRLPADERLSWMVAILPYMVQENSSATLHKGEKLFGRFDLGRGWQDDANRQAMTGAPAWFVCPAAPRPPAGRPAPTQYVGLAGFGTDAPTLPKSDPRAGFFGYDRVITREDVKRGTAETMIVTERAGAVGPWGAGGPATVAGVDPEKRPFVPAQFGGLHPHGANTLFADGHVTFISDGASLRVWEDQCRINVEQ